MFMQENSPSVSVEFKPSGVTVQVPRGTLLAEAAGQAGLQLQMPCGGEGQCGKCRVRLLEAAAPPTAQDKRHFSAKELSAGWRLACQTPVQKPLIVEVPETSLAHTAAKILVAGQVLAEFPIDPPVVKRFVVLPPPTREDDAADLDRLARGLQSLLTGTQPASSPWERPLRVEWPLLRQLPERLRQYGFQGTAVLADEQLLDFEPGDTTAEHYAVAVDVGTTTLAAALIHLPTGRQLAVRAELNPQSSFGDDVISRISYAQRSLEQLEELRRAVILALDRMIGQLAGEAGIRREQIYHIALVGNTTMQHLACGISPQYLGQVPFTPVAKGPLTGPAGGLGLRIHPAGLVYVCPVIGGYVGGDIVAGMVAAGLAHQDRPTLFLDIGTNGEIVLAAGGRLYAAATAAGPAFEGARITHGMRAAPGAIERISFNGQWHLHTVGAERPKGICGSALIDLAAELLRFGLLRPDGRLVPKTAQEAEGPPGRREPTGQAWTERWTAANGEPAFVVCPAEQTATGQPILLTQRDVRQLQLAAGAIRCGIELLLRRAGLRPGDLEAIWVAGGFGNYIRRRNAQRIGLLPPEVPVERIRFLGNMALAGARLLVLSRQARQEAEHLARRTEHIDLASDPDFAATFAESMIFPDSPSEGFL